MKNKKILVLAKFYKGEINPFDASSLECALQTGCKDITVVTMAPLTVLDPLKALTRLGVKTLLISDKAFAGADTLATSKVLAKVVERLQPDVVFCGRQSVDGDTSQIPPQLSQRTGYSFQSNVMRLEENFAYTRTGEKFLIEDKTIVAFEKSFTLRFPSIFSKQSEVEIWDNTLLQICETECGQKGSPTRVIKTYENTVGRRNCRFVSAEQLDKCIQEGLQSSKIERVYTGEKTPIVYYVGDIKEKALSIAEKAVEIFATTPVDVVKQIKEKQAKIILFADDEKTKVLAAKVAVILETGLCADCTSLRIENGKFIMTRPALGGNVTADIVCDKEIAVATVRTNRKKNADIVFGIGKGALGDIAIIETLAKKYNAELVASRTVVDMGKMPYENQVGLTGKTIAPKVYVAFGISGAVQHTCAIEGAGKIIAINPDKNARIFDYADYGIVKTIKELNV